MFRHVFDHNHLLSDNDWVESQYYSEYCQYLQYNLGATNATCQLSAVSTLQPGPYNPMVVTLISLEIKKFRF